MVTVSVVVPTYERFGLLTTRSLPSILGQTHTDLDVHIVGDGTSDAAQIEAYLAELGDPRVRFTNRPHQVYPENINDKWGVLGLEVLNYGLDTTRGEWVSVLADDDAWEPDLVEVLLAYALAKEVDFAYGMTQYHWADGRPQTAGAWPPGHGQLSDSSYVYRAGMGYRYDPTCITRGIPEDADLWTRMYAAGVKFAFLPRVVVHYYVNRQ
jgi:glycosyltransferase involved in cell wall biosynthesis